MAFLLQDDEYFASLQADREKELKAKEEAEAALAEERRKEEEFRRKQQEEEVPYFDWHMDKILVLNTDSPLIPAASLFIIFLDYIVF